MLSRERFANHHMWLSEIFEGLQPVSGIVPEDMGFGLVGELAELTDGLVPAPDTASLLQDIAEDDLVKRKGRFDADSPDEQLVYKHLSDEQMSDFEKRVDTFMDRKYKEIDDLKARHAKSMEKVTVGKYYLDAEERLREAGNDPAKLEAIVRDVELTMGVSLHERGSVVCVKSDAFAEKEEEEARARQEALDGKSVSAPKSNGSIDDGAGLLDEFTEVNELVSEEVEEADGGTEPLDDMDIDDGGRGAPLVSNKKDDDWVVVSSKDATSPAPPLPSFFSIEQPATFTAAPTEVPSPTAISPAPIPAPEEAQPPTLLITTDASTSTPGMSGTPGTAEAGDLVESMFEDGDFSAFDGVEPATGLEGTTDFAGGEDLLDFGDADDSGPVDIAVGDAPGPI
jgi:hypothetical protein